MQSEVFSDALLVEACERQNEQVATDSAIDSIATLQARCYVATVEGIDHFWLTGDAPCIQVGYPVFLDVKELSLMHAGQLAKNFALNAHWSHLVSIFTATPCVSSKFSCLRPESILADN